MIWLALAFTLTASISGREARASSYLFRLSADEIHKIMSFYYPRGYDREAILRQMAEPFDCRNFGDLCEEVGPDYAYRIVESAWSKARMEFPIEAIDRAMQNELEDFGQRWFERLFPQGVPTRDDFWGVAYADGESSCKKDAFAESGDFRIIHSSRRFNAGVLVWGRVKVHHFKRGWDDNWKLSRADRLEVEGTVYLTVGGNTTVHPVSDVKDDAKRVAASFVYGGTVTGSVPFVDGCGGVGSNSALWACSCSGELPPFQP